MKDIEVDSNGDVWKTCSNNTRKWIGNLNVPGVYNASLLCKSMQIDDEIRAKIVNTNPSTERTEENDSEKTSK